MGFSTITQNVLGMVVHIYNPSTQKVEAGVFEFKSSLNYIARLCLKTHKKQNKKKNPKTQNLPIAHHLLKYHPV
jgi:hypothetical protein